MKLHSLRQLNSFNHSAIICIIVDLDNLMYYSVEGLIEELKQYKMDFILESADYEVQREFEKKGYPVYNRLSLIEKQILNIFEAKMDKSSTSYVFDYEQRLVMAGDSVIKIRNKPFLILNYLVKNKNKICTREEIIRGISTSDIRCNPQQLKMLSDLRTIDVHMHYLRHKLNDNRLKTVIHKGYIFEDE